MGFTDAPVMAGPEVADQTTEQLHALVRQHEEAQDKAANDAWFSTSLTDDDRRYLDLCAELYARGEYGTGRKPCSEGPQP